MITSRSNERVKLVRALQQNKERARTGLHVAEGDKLVWEAIRSNADVRTVYAREEVLSDLPSGIEVLAVSDSVMEAICSQQTPQALCAVIRTPDTTCPEQYPVGLIVALDRIQDPGNLGTILRTADALGACGLLLSRECADPFSPKCLRAAMGSTYHLPIWQGDLPKEITRLTEQDFVCICGHLKGSEIMPEHGRRTVLVIGNEGNGVSGEVADRCDLYRFPMKGKAESLNAAVFAAIMIYQIQEQMPLDVQA